TTPLHNYDKAETETWCKHARPVVGIRAEAEPLTRGATNMAIIIGFFVAHWVISVFFQTFFQHRYGAHRMYTMSKGWERFFYICSFVFQGASFLNPRAYAILHREHHAFSDTERDPHSPHQFANVWRMMLWTKRRYDNYAYRRVEPEPRFDG